MRRIVVWAVVGVATGFVVGMLANVMSGGPALSRSTWVLAATVGAVTVIGAIRDRRIRRRRG